MSEEPRPLLSSEMVTLEVSADQPPESSFAETLRRLRGRAIRWWITQAVSRSLVWLGMITTLFMAVRGPLGLKAGYLLAGYISAAVLVAGAHLWFTRGWAIRFVERLDEHIGAHGRLRDAAEFVDDARANPLKRLLVLEVTAWLKGHDADELFPRWPVESYLFVPVAAVMYLLYRFT